MTRLSAALWFVGMIALIVTGFAPAARAHMGHEPGYGHGGHRFHVHVTHHSRADDARAVANSAATTGGHLVEVRSVAAPGAATPSSDIDHDTCACCVIGHCATCVAVIAADAIAVWLPARGADFGWHRAAPMADATPSSLKRPPRS